MKKSIKRGIAISLAFINLFFNSVSLAEKTKDDTNIEKYVLVDNNNIPIYKKFNQKTGELDNISIFDNDNITTHQYGASQRVFKFKFDKLIREPLIWEEMQKYYPVSKFESEEDALFFYQKYFEIIYECGCGYAAAANYVFHYFEGREDEFYQAFGFPMYTMDGDTINFNYELFMLKFFNFLNLVINNDYESINKMIEKDFDEHKLFRFIETSNPKKEIGKNERDWTDEDYDRYYELEEEYDKRFKELNDKYKNSKRFYKNLGVTLDGAFGHLYIFLGNYGIKLDTSCDFDDYKFDSDDIVACDKSIMYPIYSDGEMGKSEEVGLHYVYVVEVDGKKVIVSSWGNKYLLDYSISPNNQTVKLHAH